MPERLQLQMLQTLAGMQECRMLRPAYAVEYDYLPAYQCHSTLETKRVGNLFFSGQLNGTTGAPRATCVLRMVFWLSAAIPCRMLLA